MTTINNLEDVQGIVFSGYKSMAYCRYYLLKINDATSAKQWLKHLIDNNVISHGADRPSAQEHRLNLAISYSGFKYLNLSPQCLDSFEIAFQEGMDSPRRSVLLGDLENANPQTWRWGSGNQRVDLLLIAFSKNNLTHNNQCDFHEKSFAAAQLDIVHLIDTDPIAQGSSDFRAEHFGFADGASNPVVKGFPTNTGNGDMIATGEFLLGYPNEYDGKLTKVPQFSEYHKDLGNNGTYLVLRQLEQDVRGFWRYINTEANRQNITPDYLAAKFVGRWKSGALLKQEHTQDPYSNIPQSLDNNFDFTDDPHGYGCPLGSHIRRANPRGIGLGTDKTSSLKVANRHRILRRGRRYGKFLDDPLTDNDKEERGLVFLGINANIERQFEFVQHAWINNVKFNGLYDEDDPLVGSAANSNFTIQEQPLRRRVCGIQKFVTTRGGGYFFLPSLAALRWLGGG